MTELDQDLEPRDGFSRRTMLRGAATGGVALPLLAACGGGDDTSGGGSDDAGGSGGSGGSDDAGGSGGSGKKGPTVAAADVPVGGGVVLKDDKVVVTQPAKGDFKAFTAVCTHQGCTVGKVEGGEIVCPCHGSHFSIKDGQPVAGPAQSPLAAKKVAVRGSQVSVS